MSRQLSRQDLNGFVMAQILAAACGKRLWVVVNVVTKNVHFVVCDRIRDGSCDFEDGSGIAYDLDEAIALYNSID